MRKYHFMLLFLSLAKGCVLAAGLGIQDTQPDPNLWTVVGDVSIQAICYANPNDVKVTEPEIGAIVRVYLLNTGKQPLTHLGSTQDSGFTLQGTDANGNPVTLRKPEREMSMTRISLAPGKTRAYTIVVHKSELDFLNKKPLSVDAFILNTSDKQLTKVQAPIQFK